MLGLLSASLVGADPGISDRELVVTFTVEVSGLEAFALASVSTYRTRIVNRTRSSS